MQLVDDAKCSFCGQPRSRVTAMVSDGRSFICDECIGLCNAIICEEIEHEDPASSIRRELGPLRAALPSLCENGLPKNLADELLGAMNDVGNE